jgi:hypothetical protein
VPPHACLREGFCDLGAWRLFGLNIGEVKWSKALFSPAFASKVLLDNICPIMSFLFSATSSVLPLCSMPRLSQALHSPLAQLTNSKKREKGKKHRTAGIRWWSPTPTTNLPIRSFHRANICSSDSRSSASITIVMASKKHVALA